MPMSISSWLEPWTPIERAEERIALEAELRLELGAAHPLSSLPTVALARRHDRDDVLFEIDQGRVAEVHLTWRRSREPDPRWPETIIYECATAWVDERMRPHHEAFLSAS
jgi:hypothetical protein